MTRLVKWSLTLKSQLQIKSLKSIEMNTDFNWVSILLATINNEINDSLNYFRSTHPISKIKSPSSCSWAFIDHRTIEWPQNQNFELFFKPSKSSTWYSTSQLSNLWTSICNHSTINMTPIWTKSWTEIDEMAKPLMPNQTIDQNQSDTHSISKPSQIRTL